MPEAQTWVIIIKFRADIAFNASKNAAPPPFFRQTSRESPRFKITETQSILLDKPILIVPNGQTESVEVIPITDPTLLHGRNFKRVLR